MDNNIYREALQHTSTAFAYHEAVFDDKKEMVDYTFLDVNQAFEEFTGLKREKIINQNYIRDVVRDKEHALKWVQIYREVVSEQKTIEFVEHSNEFNRYYSVKAYPSGVNQFITIFTDMTFEKNMQEIARYLIESMGSDLDYQKITEFALEVSGADYAAFNLFHVNGRDFETVALCGPSRNISRASKILGIHLLYKNWDYDRAREEMTRGNVITYFNALHELTGTVIPKEVIIRIEKIFKLGAVIIAKITKEGKTLGDFTLFFKKDNQLRNRDLLMLYMSLLGLYIEKNRLDLELKTSQRMLYTLAEYAPIGFMSCDRTGEITYTNAKLLEIMDSPSAMATKEINLIEFPKLKASGFSDKLLECMEKDSVITYEMGYTSLWGKYSWVRVHFTPYREKDTVAGANIIIDDITKSKQFEDTLKEKVNRDPLTMTFNRNALDSVLLDRLNESKNRGYASCLAVIDVDDFKKINDSRGHGAGDQVLRYLAARIKEDLGDKDLVIRTGGDEFLIYLHDIENKELAEDIILRVFRKISSEYRLEDEALGNPYRLAVSCSIGVALFPEDGETTVELMSQADRALYMVKESGKANFLFISDEAVNPHTI